MVDENRLQLEILHEIAMSIGASLDTSPMLQATLPLLLRRLDCTMVSVVQLRDGRPVPVQTLPRRTDMAKLEAFLARHAHAPGDVVELDGRFVYSWRLPDFGVLVLARGAPMPEPLRHELQPIAAKLSVALRACLQYEQLRDAQRQLAESEERWKFALEGTGDGLWDWNPQTDRALFTPRWKGMLGYADDEFPNEGAAWVEILHPADRARVLAELEAYFGGERAAFEVEFRGRCKDGSWKWFLSRGLVVARRDDGAPLRMIGTHSDVTARKRAEHELDQHRNHLEALVEERTAALSIAKEAAEAASRAKSAFLANMSHELRTPLNGIMGLTGLALRRTDDPKLVDSLGKVGQCARQLLGIIDDVLDISRMEAERLTLDVVEFSFAEVVVTLLERFERKAAEKGLLLEVEASSELTSRVLVGDPMRLGQLMGSFVDNALKFTERGSVHVRASLVEEGPREVLVRVEVQDTGIGVAPAAQGRLFAPFEQADGSLSRKYGGTGLGLHLGKRLAELMGGAVGVVSAEGRGSTFWFTARLSAWVPARPRSADGHG